jgi:hypothetical protein
MASPPENIRLITKKKDWPINIRKMSFNWALKLRNKENLIRAQLRESWDGSFFEVHFFGIITFYFSRT